LKPARVRLLARNSRYHFDRSSSLRRNRSASLSSSCFSASCDFFFFCWFLRFCDCLHFSGCSSSRGVSFGWVADDGIVVESISGNQDVRTYASSYGGESTVGCGIDWEKGMYYFTRNRKRVAEFKSPIVYRKLYPVFTICQWVERAVKVNFGGDRENRPFLYVFDRIQC